jgi:adenylosuccinate synthase
VGLVTGYRDGNGGLTQKLPTSAADWKELKPEVKLFKGWGVTRGLKDRTQLPDEARIYLDALSELVEVPIAYLSTGPDRSEGYAQPGTFLDGLLA